jgi:hypothetical protein
VQLDTAEARVLVVGGLPICFWGQWCRIVAKAGGDFHRLVVEGIEGSGIWLCGGGSGGGLGLFWWCNCSNGGSCICSYW